MRISDWSSDVCSSDLIDSCPQPATGPHDRAAPGALAPGALAKVAPDDDALFLDVDGTLLPIADRPDAVRVQPALLAALEHLSRCFGGALAPIRGLGIAPLDATFAPLLRSEERSVGEEGVL